MERHDPGGVAPRGRRMGLAGQTHSCSMLSQNLHSHVDLYKVHVRMTLHYEPCVLRSTVLCCAMFCKSCIAEEDPCDKARGGGAAGGGGGWAAPLPPQPPACTGNDTMHHVKQFSLNRLNALHQQTV